MSDEIIKECKRQEESCLYTSAALFEWLKCLRVWRVVFVVLPIILGAFTSWQLISEDPGWKVATGIAALIAGVLPAIYKALDFDVSLEAIARSANTFKVLQDRFRQAHNIVAAQNSEALQTVFAELMNKMDEVRSASPIPPERFFEKARKKVEAGHYKFDADKA